MGILALVSIVLTIGAAWGLAFWAHRANRDRSALVGLYLLFGLPGGLLLLYGAALAVNGRSRGVLWLAVGLGMCLPLLKPVRRAFASFTPMDPDSAVDMSGLSILLAIIGFLGGTYLLTPTPADVGGEVGIEALAAQFIASIGLAYVVVGLGIKRTFREANARLGLVRPTLTSVGIALGLVVAAFMTLAVGGILTYLLQPDVSAEIERITEDITANVKNPIGAVFFGLGAGIGEELLIRGAIQPKYGLLLSSLLFALLHSQYGISFVLLAVFLVGVLLGLERKYLGTTAAIITHAVINTIAVLLGSG